MAGPMARMTLTVTCQTHEQGLLSNELIRRRTWLKPFVAPMDARLGDEAVMKIKMAPVSVTEVKHPSRKYH